MRRGPESFLAVDQHGENDTPERSGPLVDAHHRLESAIARLDAICQQGATLRSNASIVVLSRQLEHVTIDRPIDPIIACRSDVGSVLMAGRLALGEIDHR